MATKAKKKAPALAPRPKALRADADDLGSPDDIDWSKARVSGRGLYAGKKRIVLSLAELRQASNKTQVEMSEASGIAQGEVSKIEHRDDMLMSTLRRYVEALGAKVEIVAEFPRGHRIVIDLDDRVRKAR